MTERYLGYAELLRDDFALELAELCRMISISSLREGRYEDLEHDYSFDDPAL